MLDAGGHLVRSPDGTILPRQAANRWGGSGRSVFDTVAGTPWLARRQAGTAAEQHAAALR